MEPITVSGPMMLFLICMTGFAGIVDSAAGGGGLISLPAYLFAGLPAHYTYGTNKFSAACGTTFATARFLRSGALDLKVGLLAAAGSFAGSAAGAHLALLLSDGALRLMMLCILPVAAAIILTRWRSPDHDPGEVPLTRARAALAVAIGVGIGCYDGLFGPGTGTFAIIAFSTLMGYDMSGLVVFHIAIPCAISGIAGNLIGSRLALKGGAKVIRPMMLVVLVLLLGQLTTEVL